MELWITSNWPMSSWKNYKTVVMSYSSRTYRHRNPKAQDKEQSSTGPSFFHSGKGAIQTKKDDAFFQTKLSVNQPGDEFEQEADSVAGSVVGGTSGADVKRKKISGIQRLSSSKEEENYDTNDQRMKHDKDIQRMPLSNSGGGGTASSGVSSRVEQSSGTGRQLSGKLLAEMSHQFGADLSDVTIHTDSEATALNKELGAHAFTHGKDIYFNAGKFNPETAAGKFLLAHELTHVVQQSGEEDQIQRMASCPAHLNANDPVPPGWKPYYGNPSVFHCGFRGILEDRKPSPSDPMNECFYDHAGVLVDKSHAYAGCGGTPDSYDSKDSTWDHIFNDPGGIWHAGWGAFWESRKYNMDQDAQRQLDCVRSCDAQPWYLQGFCYQGCSGAMIPAY